MPSILNLKKPYAIVEVECHCRSCRVYDASTPKKLLGK